MTEFEGTRFVVTGAASGIGAATAAQLRAAGAYVAGLDRSAPVEGLVDEFHAVDLSDPAAIDTVVAGLDGVWNGLLNIAGVSGEAPAELVMKVNFLGLRHLTEALWPKLAKGGSVTNVASAAGVMWRSRQEFVQQLVDTPDFAAGLDWFHANPPEGKVYNFSKEAVILWSMWRALPAFRDGIRVNAVAPSLTKTPLFADFEKSIGAERIKGMEESLGRFAEPSDVARALLFLASPATEYVAGQILGVDGGTTAAMVSGVIPLPGY
ncbi:coniferyl-alcohol dehydrogenase [Microbacterium sp. NPDC077663]|uniref:coniferyl-alcohol dehydrogenase n=1 Tax=Microbacterium sp. NPDC077663 TaxID=3364189 RepID=UPI0037C83325